MREDASVRTGDETEANLVLVYDALRDLARRQMRRESAAHTLQPTALVNEVYLRLMKDGPRRWSHRGHFFAAAGEAMRRILIEHARGRKTARRGSGERPASLEERWVAAASTMPDDTLLELSDALTALESEAPEWADLVKLKFFVGMTNDEIAEVLEVSPRTVVRRWRTARTWLHARMSSSLDTDDE
jgi:RNA polymerase sigma factor (TIGR02999 family)